jgi:UDP:flavonoid glycosyltransferase YjiC (YdhE family)
VHHGGEGTAMNALVAGLPQLVIIHGPNHASAAALEGRGVGLVCLPGEATGARVWESLRRVLEEPGFRAAAHEVRDEIAALPPPSELVPRLAALAS